MNYRFCNLLTRVATVIFGFGADVVTVTSGTAGNAGSVAAELITFLSGRMLDVSELNMVLNQFGDKEPLPAGSSKTIRFTREEKLSVSTSPSQLTEGIPPDAQGITINQVEATVEQYGAVVRISDVAELTAKHPIVERTIFILGLHAAEVYDVLIFNVLDAATNNYRPNGRSGDTSLYATDFVGYNDLIELDAILNGQGARPFEGGEYVLVTQPQVYAAMLKDPNFLAANQFAAPDKIWRGEVASLGGFRVVRTNSPAFAATSQATSGQTNKVYSSFALGRMAYKITDLQSTRIYVAAPGGQTDVLQQSRKMGYKFMFKSVIVNQNWIRRVRSAGLDAVNN